MTSKPPVQSKFVARAAGVLYDPASYSDDEDDDTGSRASRSTWASSNPDATILGFADGSAPTELDWRTSRIGGLPTFPPLSQPPQPSAAVCKLCSTPSPLLAQIYCPLDGSMLERVVYVFACTLKSCRGNDGSVRAYRASVLWAEEEETGEEQKKEEAAVEQKGLGSLIFGGGGAVNSNASSSNPFASSNPFLASATPASISQNPFAPSPAPANLFAPSAVAKTPTANPFAPAAPSASAPAPAAKPTSALDILTASMAKSSLSSTAKEPEARTRPRTPPPVHWPSSTRHYPAQYLTTAYESAPKPSKVSAQSVEALMELDEGKHREGKGNGKRNPSSSSSSKGGAAASGSGGDGWGKEGYEVQKVKGVDDVFLRFQERVARDGCGSQVVRYQHASVPLPFSSRSKLYAKVFPSPNSGSNDEQEGTYDPTRLPACSTCGMPTAFEYQLMPALVGILNRSGLLGVESTSSSSSASSTQGKTKVTSANLSDTEGEHALDFATVMVFACLGECVDEASEEGWREEVAMIEVEE